MKRHSELEAIARTVIDCGFHLHRDIGPGLLESAYEALMFEVLRQSGLSVDRQVPVPLNYRCVVVDKAFKVDLLIANCLVIFKDGLRRIANDYYGTIGGQ